MTALAPEVVDAIAPIGLEELVAQAELLTRVDRKYVLPVAEAQAILSDAASFSQVLDVEGQRDFGYRSTYFDTPDRSSFLSAGRSHRKRWKVRTRTYLDVGSSWLEVKTRDARNNTIKQRIEHPDVCQVEGRGVLNPVGRSFVADIIGTEAVKRMSPVLVTSYRRTTLYLPASNSRVTLDVELGWTSLTNNGDIDRPQVAIIETKNGSTASAMDRLLWRRGHRPLRISKFGVGMAALHTDLPRLKWHRAMTKHLGLPRAS